MLLNEYTIQYLSHSPSLLSLSKFILFLLLAWLLKSLSLFVFSSLGRPLWFVLNFATRIIYQESYQCNICWYSKWQDELIPVPAIDEFMLFKGEPHLFLLILNRIPIFCSASAATSLHEKPVTEECGNQSWYVFSMFNFSRCPKACSWTCGVECRQSAVQLDMESRTALLPALPADLCFDIWSYVESAYAWWPW